MCRSYAIDTTIELLEHCRSYAINLLYTKSQYKQLIMNIFKTDSPNIYFHSYYIYMYIYSKQIVQYININIYDM